MTTTYFKELREELLKGATKKEHPFRYCTLGTVGLEHLARLRTIVIREVSKDLKLTFYTDKRSKKIIHIKENPKVSLLFYHPKKLLQLKVEGLASIINDPEVLNTNWKAVSPGTRKDYKTLTAPGSSLESPDNLEYLDNENFFCTVEIDPFKVEYLKLGSPDHLRIRFSKDAEQWEGEFLVP